MFAILVWDNHINSFSGRPQARILAEGLENDVELRARGEEENWTYINDFDGNVGHLWICEYNTRLDLLRQANGYTQAGLSAATGIPFRTLQEYCQGRKPITSANIVRCHLLAKALACKIEDLVDMEEWQHERI